MVSKGCPIGTISRKGYNRKSYTKKSGKMVKATYVKRGCTKNMGMPGKTPAKKRVIKIPKDAKHLSNYGYKTSAKKGERLSALKKAVKKYGYASVIHKLSALRTLTKKSQPSKSKKYNSDIKGLQEWKMKKSSKKSVKKSKKIMKGGSSENNLPNYTKYNENWEKGTFLELQNTKNKINSSFNSLNENEKKNKLIKYCKILNNFRSVIFEMYSNVLNEDNINIIRTPIKYNNEISIKQNKSNFNEYYSLFMSIYNDAIKRKIIFNKKMNQKRMENGVTENNIINYYRKLASNFHKMSNNEIMEEEQMRLANNEARAILELKAIENAKNKKDINLIESNIYNSIRLIQTELNNITNITSDKYLQLLAGYSIKLVEYYNILLKSKVINKDDSLFNRLTYNSDEITSRFGKNKNGKYVFGINSSFIESRKNICDELYNEIINLIIEFNK